MKKTHNLLHRFFSAQLLVLCVVTLITSPLDLSNLSFQTNTAHAAAVGPGGVSSNLRIWVKADAGITADVNGVSAWFDQSILGNHLAQNNNSFKPGFTDLSINYNPAIHFLDSDDKISTSTTGNLSNLTGYSVFVVANMDSQRNFSRLVSEESLGVGDRTFAIALDNTAPASKFRVINDFSSPIAAAETNTSLTKPTLYEGRYDGGNIYMNRNSAQLASSLAGNATISRNYEFYVGSAFSNSALGKVSEVIVFNADNSALNRYKIESYLGLKYGIWLDQNTPTPYIASNGTMFWDNITAGTYNNDIFGLGRDDDSGLDQRISTSQEADDILTVALDNNFTAANTDVATRTTALSADRSFLVFANNDAATTLNTSSSELDPNFSARIDREWQVQATNFSQSVNLKLDGFDDTYTLVKDADGDFTSGASIVGPLNSNGEITSVSLADGEFITLMKGKPFLMTVKTDNPGISGTTEFKIETEGTGYNYNVDCNNDGTYEATGVTGDYTCTYGSAGTYQVAINDNAGDETGFPRFFYNNASDEEKILSIDQWGALKWESMGVAFFGASNLVLNATDTPDLTGVSSLDGMFRNNSSLVDNGGQINTWDMSSATDIKSMFYGATVFNSDVSSWDVSNVTSMVNTFRDADTFNQNIGAWNTANVELMNNMFFGAEAFNQDLNTWDVRKVTSMENMFREAIVFDGNITSWETGAVLSMANMFFNAHAFNQDISYKAGGGNQGGDAWDVGIVTNFSGMFASFSGIGQFNQAIGNWDTSSATDMSLMFARHENFNRPLNDLDVSNVRFFNSMFASAGVFNQPLDLWLTSSAENMAQMFGANGSPNPIFNQDISSWDVSGVSNFAQMFRFNAAFNQDISGWNTSAATDMSFMFIEASSFNQNLGNWNISGVTNVTSMLDNSGLSVRNYDNTLIGWDAQTLQTSLTLGAVGLQYCAAENERQNIITNDSWTIADAGRSCPRVEFVLNSGASTDESTGDNFIQLLVSGEVTRATQVLIIDLASGTATQGVAEDYIFSSPLIIDIPIGSYDGTLATSVSISNLTINDDTLYEFDETINFQLDPSPTNNLDFDDVDGVDGLENSFTYTITNDDPEPILDPVSIASNNLNDTTLAKEGDEITINFTSNTSLQNVSVDIVGNSAVVTGGPTNWSATYMVQAGDPEGLVSFTIDAESLGGRPIAQLVSTTDLSSVIIDLMPPLPPTVTSPVDGSTVAGTFTMEGACETDAIVSISNPNLIPPSVSVTCVGGAYSTSITFDPSVVSVVENIIVSQTDLAGNKSADNNVSYLIDQTNPNILSILRSNPVESRIFSDQNILVFEVEFSEDVFDVDVSDFIEVISPGSLGDITGVSQVSASQYLIEMTIEVTDPTEDSQFSISLDPLNDIVDLAGNSISLELPTGEVYNYRHPRNGSSSINDSQSGNPFNSIIQEKLGNEKIEKCLLIDEDKLVTYDDFASESSLKLSKTRLKDTEQYILGGYSDNTIRENRTLSRVEQVKILLLGHCLPILDADTIGSNDVNGNLIKEFKDLPKVDSDPYNDWMQDVTYSGAYYGIVKGYNDGTVQPTLDVSFAEYITMLVRVGELAEQRTYSISPEFKNKEGWYYPYIGKAMNEGLVDAQSNYLSSITRAYSFEKLYQAILTRNIYEINQ